MTLFRTISILIILFPLISCSAETDRRTSEETNQTILFFNNMKDLCGRTFTGRLDYPDDPDHDMAGQEFKMFTESCDDNELRIPFHVGEDTSRTWVLTLTGQSLLLKHDHRHSDGTPEDLTMYGGFANSHGNAFRQYFPADQETADMLPEAATNVWMMEIDPENKEFIYYLERHNEPRFRAIFQMEN
jgi:hypothetical protein